jgi:hypothetical protein
LTTHEIKTPMLTDGFAPVDALGCDLRVRPL